MNSDSSLILIEIKGGVRRGGEGRLVSECVCVCVCVCERGGGVRGREGDGEEEQKGKQTSWNAPIDT